MAKHSQRAKINNPTSGFVVGVIEIRANAALQTLVSSSLVISAAVLLMEMGFDTGFADKFWSDTYLELM